MSSCVVTNWPLTPDGYGRKWLEGQDWYAHRRAWVQANGAIPDGLHIDHLCRNRACINVEHMELVTPQENVRRGVGPSAINARKTKCYRGHSFADARFYIRRGRVARACRQCHRDYQTQYRAAHGPITCDCGSVLAHDASYRTHLPSARHRDGLASRSALETPKP